MLIEKYVWLVGKLNDAGDKGLTSKEINEKWLNDDLSRGLPIPRTTFIRWVNAIETTFNIIISCRRKGGYHYYIENRDELESNGLSKWLLNTYSTINALSQNVTLKNRILVEDIPSNNDYLLKILGAMRKNKVINIIHKRFKSERRCRTVEPYGVKLMNKRWYMMSLDRESRLTIESQKGRDVDFSDIVDKLRLHALDRIEGLTVTSETFKLPNNFDLKAIYADYYGVFLDSSVKKCHVRISASGTLPCYLRTLPLHQSQRECGNMNNRVEFDLFLRPTDDFLKELLRYGDELEVLEPEDVRERLFEISSRISEKYKRKD